MDLQSEAQALLKRVQPVAHLLSDLTCSLSGCLRPHLGFHVPHKAPEAGGLLLGATEHMSMGRVHTRDGSLGMSLCHRGPSPACSGASWDQHMLVASLPRDLIIMAALAAVWAGQVPQSCHGECDNASGTRVLLAPCTDNLSGTSLLNAWQSWLTSLQG